MDKRKIDNELKDRMYEILGELSEVRYQVETMNYVLGILAEAFEIKNQMEEAYLVQLFAKYGADLEQRVANAICDLDRSLLKFK